LSFVFWDLLGTSSFCPSFHPENPDQKEGVTYQLLLSQSTLLTGFIKILSISSLPALLLSPQSYAEIRRDEQTNSGNDSQSSLVREIYSACKGMSGDIIIQGDFIYNLIDNVYI